MEAYYNSQASNSMPHFTGHYRQKGSGFGALVSGIGRVALHLARRNIWPTAKRNGRKLLVTGAPAIAEFATKKKTTKQALKSTAAKTIKKQSGGSRHFRRRIIRQNKSSGGKAYQNQNSPIKAPFLQRPSCKEVDRISSLRSKMRTNIVTSSDATHSSMDLFEKPRLLVTLDQAFAQKTGPTGF